MPSYRIITLYSGSSGNAVYLDTGRAKLLIDAGKSTRALQNALKSATGLSLSDLDAIFITHEHTDHIGALSVLHKHCEVPIHMTETSFSHAGLPEKTCFVTHAPLFSEAVGNAVIHSFPTPHDSAMSVGYRIEFTDKDGREVSLGVATDIGHVTEEVRRGLVGCEAVVLEANHDPQRLINGPYPYPLKQRILSPYGHLANGDCAAFARELAERGTRHFLLAHLSRENNTPELALAAVSEALRDAEVTLRVADPSAPISLC